MAKDFEEESLKKEDQSNELESEARESSSESTRATEKTINPLIVVSFIILFIFAIFAIVNTHEVSINFLFADVNLPLIIVILGSFILGALTSALTSWRSRKNKSRNR